jgi:hypothetical protein
MCRIGVADAFSNRLDAVVGMEEESPRLGHPTGGDPFDRSLARRALESCRDVRRRSADGAGHFFQRQRSQAVSLDVAQRFADDSSVLRAARFKSTADLVKDQRQLAVLNPRLGSLVELPEQVIEEGMPIGRNADHRRSALTHTLERLEHPHRIRSGQARRAKTDTPDGNVRCREKAMGRSRRNEENIARLELPRPTLLDRGRSLRDERHRGERVHGRRAATLWSVALDEDGSVFRHRTSLHPCHRR